MPDGSLIVVGAGQAGGWAALSAREAGWRGRITLLGAEPDPPYERPPLSKDVLVDGPASFTGWIKPAGAYIDAAIDLQSDTHVVAIDRAAARVETADGSRRPYDRLVLATGAEVRTLNVPGADQDSVITLRTLADADRLHRGLHAAERVCIVGGGFIGLEVASSARRIGCEVLVVEFQDRVMARAMPPQVSAFANRLHARNGVRIDTSMAIEWIEPLSPHAPGTVHLRNLRQEGGSALVGLVVAGVGIQPNTALAEAAGLEIDGTVGGIAVDETLATSDPAIFAAGDCTAHFHPRYGRRIRLESWQNAQNQGIAAGTAAAGKPQPYADIPWVWTDQHGVNIQSCGIAAEDARWVARGDTEGDSFALTAIEDGVVTQAITVGRAKDMAALKRLIDRAVPVDPAEVADPGTDLRKLLKKT